MRIRSEGTLWREIEASNALGCVAEMLDWPMWKRALIVAYHEETEVVKRAADWIRKQENER